MAAVEARAAQSGRFPARHGSAAQAWQFMVRRFKPFVGKRQIPDTALCDAYGHALSRGDAPMDELLDWMMAAGMRETRPQFLQALQSGIDTVPEAPEPLRKFFTHLDCRPEWLDEDLLARGCEAYAMLGEEGYYSGRDFILMGGYQSSSINEVLARAGGLKKGPTRRLAETMDWHMKITEPGGLGRFGEGFMATVQVRLVHALVRRRVNAQPDWDYQQDGMAVNQTDMVGTYLGGGFGLIVGAMLLGRLSLSPADFRALLHLFKYAHWIMGVEEAFLSDDPAECAHRLVNLVLMQPGPTEVCVQMAQALAQQPLEIEFDRFQSLRRWYRYQRHLSVNRFFLGRRGMVKLGLSTQVLPWYPLLTFLPKALGSLSGRYLLPGQRARMVRKGRQIQQALTDMNYGRGEHGIDPETVGASG